MIWTPLKLFFGIQADCSIAVYSLNILYPQWIISKMIINVSSDFYRYK